MICAKKPVRTLKEKRAVLLQPLIGSVQKVDEYVCQLSHNLKTAEVNGLP